MEPILLALSTFRQSDIVIEKTIELAKREGRGLIALFVVDVNLARYFIGSELIVGTHVRQKCEAELLEEYRKAGDAKVESIAGLAAEAGVPCETIVVTGRFGIETMKVISARKPGKVTLTRSNRPKWVVQFFGSPVDYVIERADCPVLEDYGVEEEQKKRAETRRDGHRMAFSFPKSLGGIRYGVLLIGLGFLLAMVFIAICQKF